MLPIPVFEFVTLILALLWLWTLLGILPTKNIVSFKEKDDDE